MKLLLDESIPRQLGRHFPKRFEVRTAGQMGWAGLENGELIKQATAHGFDALITADQNIEHQQNLDNLPMPILVLTGTERAFRTFNPSYHKLWKYWRESQRMAFTVCRNKIKPQWATHKAFLPR